MNDEGWMRAALRQAQLAAALGEVPVGAVLVDGGEILAAGFNRRESDRDPTAHAEVVALRSGARRRGGWRLDGCELFVTLEPCAMCAGAMVNARLRRLVFGATDPKGGFCGTLGDLVRDPRLNHRLEVTGGVLAAECGRILSRFFAGRR
jgi:tRNA(adenine34) deaminase